MQNRIKNICKLIKGKRHTVNESLLYKPNNEIKAMKESYPVYSIDNGNIIGYEVRRSTPNMNAIPSIFNKGE